METTTETISGEPLQYAHGGAGPELLFLHGENGPVSSERVAEKLSSHFHVLLPTLPGFGESTRPSWVTTVDDVAFELIELLDLLGIDAVDLVGESLGGWIALDLAARHPERVRSLCLVNAMGVLPEGEEFADIFHLADEEVLRRSYATAPPTDIDFVLQARADAMTARLGWHPRFHDPKLVHRLHRVAAPALVAAGARDGIVPASAADRIASLLPRAERVTIKDCAHFVSWDDPQALAQCIEDFARRSVGATAR